MEKNTRKLSHENQHAIIAYKHRSNTNSLPEKSIDTSLEQFTAAAQPVR